MSITAIIMTIIGIAGALLGGLAGHGFGKVSGRKEGAQQQVIEQAQATVQAVKERAHVESTVGGITDHDLDARLSKYDRPD